MYAPLTNFAAFLLQFSHYVVRSHGIVILTYHRINDTLPPGLLVTSSKVFRSEMKYLKRYCEVLDAHEMMLRLKDSQRIKEYRRPQVVITFDDGYKDNYINALPILKELDLPSIISLPTGFIGTDKKFSHFQDMPSPDFMNWDEVLEMSRHKAAVAAHSVSHPHLQHLTKEKQKAEIEGSIRQIQERIPNNVAQAIFCYPYGEYNADTLNILREMGIAYAMMVEPGINTGIEDPLLLKRVCAYGTDNQFLFIRKVNFCFVSGIRSRMDMIKDVVKNFELNQLVPKMSFLIRNILSVVK